MPKINCMETVRKFDFLIAELLADFNATNKYIKDKDARYFIQQG